MFGFLKIFNTLMVSYGSKNPLRDYFYRLFRNIISKRLSKHGALAYSSAKIMEEVDFSRISNAEKESIITLANKSMENCFNYLGSGDCILEPILWNNDFKNGFKWPLECYYKKYIQVNLSDNADVKIPRELSRSHFLLHLALAYKFTGKVKYAQKAYGFIVNWIDNNPLMYSINWCCAMDVGIRAMNWIWALSLLHEYQVSDEINNKINGSLYQHGWFIYHNLEGNIFRYNNNHYYSDLVGLLHIALFFRNDKNGSKWFDFALKEFYRETRLQILPCGMHYEGSTHYHRLVLELVIPTITLLQRNGYSIPADIIGRYESMFDFVKQVIMPDGTFPIIADQDNGRGLPWGAEDINDMRYLLSLGATLFNRADFKSSGNGYNIYSAIFGEIDSDKNYNSIPDENTFIGSKFFRDAGLVVMRNDISHLVYNADNQGMYKDSGAKNYHTHSDWFSFVLAVKDIQFIVDPGTYVYSSDPSLRNMFRSTAMHNTISIDGKSQAEIPDKKLWSLNHHGFVRNIRWVSSVDSDKFSAEHTAFMRLTDPIIHKRSIEFDKKLNQWLIEDTLLGKEEHIIESWLHFDEGVLLEITDNNDAIIEKKGIKLGITFIGNNNLKLTIMDTYLSKSYGVKQASKALRISCDEKLPMNIKTKISLL